MHHISTLNLNIKSLTCSMHIALQYDDVTENKLLLADNQFYLQEYKISITKA